LWNIFFVFVFGRKWQVFFVFVYFLAEKENLFFGYFYFTAEKVKFILGRPLVADKHKNGRGISGLYNCLYDTLPFRFVRAVELRLGNRRFVFTSTARLEQ